MAFGGRKYGMTVSSPVSFSVARPARRPLRVALFSGNYDCVRDGANRALNRLVGYLLDTGMVEVRVFSPRAPRPAFKSVGEVRAVRSLALPGRPEYRLALGLPRGTQRELEAFAPDLVHLSAPDMLGRKAQRWARARGVPVIASLHTRFETYPEYYGLPFLRGPIERYLHRFYGDCDRILVPNQPIATEFASIYGTDRVAIWGRGIDPRLFASTLRDPALRAGWGYAPDDIVPLFFGRLVMEKGLAVFADAIDAVRASGRAVRPLIIGEGPARGWFEKRLPDAVFAGHLDGVALGRAVASADLLINPSVTEAFGNVNLEAMASGLAVVSADVPSAAALIEHGRSGLLVSPLDASAYADAVRTLIDDAALRRRLAVAAREKAGGYRWDDVLGGVLADYRLCLGDHWPAGDLPAAPVIARELAA